MSNTVVVTTEHGNEEDHKNVEYIRVDPNTRALHLSDEKENVTAIYAHGQWASAAFLEVPEEHPLSRDAVERRMRLSPKGYEYEDACRYFDLGRDYERGHVENPEGMGDKLSRERFGSLTAYLMAPKSDERASSDETLPTDSKAVLAYVELIKKHLAVIEELTR